MSTEEIEIESAEDYASRIEAERRLIELGYEKLSTGVWQCPQCQEYCLSGHRSNCTRRTVSDALKALDELGIPHRVIEPPPKDDNHKEKYRP